MKVKLAVLFILLLFAGVLLISGLQLAIFRISSIARIESVGLDVFADANLTTPLTFIDWGDVAPGENVTVQIYVQSASTMPISLWLSTENWVPLNATSWISLSWNYDGSLLQPDESIALILTLAVSENVANITTFSFDLVILGEG